MPSSTALLVSRNASLVNDISRIGCDIPDIHIETCSGEDEAYARLQRRDVVLAMLHLTSATDASVMRLLPHVTAADQPASAVVLSDPDCIHREPCALDAGATDFLYMPSDLERLANYLDDLASSAVSTVNAPTTKLDPRFSAQVPELVELMEQVQRVAPQDTTLLFTGETGTGKTRLARLVHEYSPRRDEPFLVFDCGAVSPNLIESELFGHVRGAFTGADRDRAGKLAAAAGGTLLLDEINTLPLHLQAKLLRAVDERVFEPVGSNKPLPLRARLIAVTNAPLEREVEAGRFRSDLYYRLNVVGFYLPPLRDRRAAIASLAGQFLAEFAERNRPDVRGLSASAVRALEAYSWPGNVRELRNVIERAVALCPSPQVQPRDLPEAVRGASARTSSIPAEAVLPTTATADPFKPATLAQAREVTEIRRIQEALTKHRNNRRRAAVELGVSREALYKKLHKYGLIDRP
jgi:DNA-binding NtrC family response regulator